MGVGTASTSVQGSGFRVHRHCDGARQVRPSAGRVRLSSVNRWVVTPRASGPVTTTRSPGFSARIRSWPLAVPHSTAHRCLASPPTGTHSSMQARPVATGQPTLVMSPSTRVVAAWSRPLAGSLPGHRGESIPEVDFEGLIELVPPKLKAGLKWIGAVALRLTQREQELTHAGLPRSRFDEIECGMSEGRDEARSPSIVSLKPAQRRDGIGADRVSQRRQVARIPGAALVLGQTFHDPCRRRAPRKDVECKDVRDLVGDEAWPPIRRLVDSRAGCDRRTAHRLRRETRRCGRSRRTRSSCGTRRSARETPGCAASRR